MKKIIKLHLQAGQVQYPLDMPNADLGRNCGAAEFSIARTFFYQISSEELVLRYKIQNYKIK